MNEKWAAEDRLDRSPLPWDATEADAVWSLCFTQSEANWTNEWTNTAAQEWTNGVDAVEKLMKSMVGVTGFEPASRRHRGQLARRGSRCRGGCLISGGIL
jgi:hypothetical protein